jgi:hypothetical protein
MTGKPGEKHLCGHVLYLFEVTFWQFTYGVGGGKGEVVGADERHDEVFWKDFRGHLVSEETSFPSPLEGLAI